MDSALSEEVSEQLAGFDVIVDEQCPRAAVHTSVGCQLHAGRVIALDPGSQADEVLSSLIVEPPVTVSPELIAASMIALPAG